jgi:hypothetical protein
LTPNDLAYSSVGSFLNSGTSSFYNQAQTQSGLSSSNGALNNPSISGNKNLVLYSNDIFNKYYTPTSNISASHLGTDSSSVVYPQHNYQQQQQQSQNSNIINAFYNNNNYFKTSSDYPNYFGSTSVTNQYGYMNGFAASTSQFQGQLESTQNDISFTQNPKLNEDKNQVSGLTSLEANFIADNTNNTNKSTILDSSGTNSNFYMQTNNEQTKAIKRSQNGFQGKSSNSSNQSLFRLIFIFLSLGIELKV